LLIEDFNRYSKVNDLDINIDFNLLTSNNISFSMINYELMVEKILINNSRRYDIIFFDNIYTKKYEPYLSNLNEFLSKDIMDLYLTGIASKTCIYNDRWIAIVKLFYYFIFIHIYILL